MSLLMVASISQSTLNSYTFSRIIPFHILAMPLDIEIGVAIMERGHNHQHLIHKDAKEGYHRTVWETRRGDDENTNENSKTVWCFDRQHHILLRVVGSGSLERESRDENVIEARKTV
jgi:hypothetical protein